MKKIIIFIFIFFTFLYGRVIMEMKIEEKIKICNHELILNGSGIRNKFFIDVYIGSLYLEEPKNDAESIIKSKTIKSMELIIISNFITRKNLTIFLKSELKNSITPEEFKLLENHIELLLSTFHEEIEKGDRFSLNIIPNVGVVVYKNNRFIKSIKSDDLGKRLIELWIGKNPVDKNLKKQVLGIKPLSL
jgi:hypothetical protein